MSAIVCDDITARLADVGRDGYSIVEDAISADLVDALTHDLARLEGRLGHIDEQTPGQVFFGGEPRGHHQFDRT
jgi:hypothetical protein